MKTKEDNAQGWETLIAELAEKADGGDKDAVVEHAWAVAIYQEVIKKGYLLTDLPWFKGTSYYTGDNLQLAKVD